MIKIKLISEAEIGDFINHRGKVSIISSVEEKGDYSIIGLSDGEVIIALKDQRTEIFRMKSHHSKNRM